MHEYEKINNEIREFINMQENKPIHPLPYTEENNEKNDLIKLLTELLEIYKEIQSLIENKNFENVKDKILNSDIKNSLVCESLMKILKDECVEKNNLKKELEGEKEKQSKLLEECQVYKMKISKLESDMEFSCRTQQELNRIIKDQKNLLIATKERAELDRKTSESLKNVNKELEVLRMKAQERCQIFEKEITVLKDKINEKEKNITELKTKLKEIEQEKSNLHKKMNNYEKANETLKNKLEMKEKSLNLCNAELAKLISQNKSLENSLEDIKEKSSYYERLYKATNKQNEYLNSQLAKMINLDNADRIVKDNSNIEDTSILTDQTKQKIYKKRYKKYKKKFMKLKENNDKNNEVIEEIKKKIEQIKLENQLLQKEKENKGKDDASNILLSKLENLMKQNKEYQNKLIDKEYKDKDIEKDEEKANDSFKTVNDGEITKDEDLRSFYGQGIIPSTFNDVNMLNYFNNNQEYKMNNNQAYKMNYQNNTFRNTPSQIKYKDVFDPQGLLKVKDHNNDTLFYDDTKYRRPFNLENDYEDKEILFNDNIKPPHFIREVKDKHEEALNKKINFLDKEENLLEDVISAGSSKTIKTSSSLRDMLKKTEDLQNKFEHLERQLDQIKESDMPKTKKVHDQVKAYNDYYYSDYLDLSNENDIL